jgi:hypothetical protein
VYDQSVTGVVTTSPFSQSPGSLHDRDRLNGGQSLGSKPMTRDATSSKIKQIKIVPPILNRTFNGSPPSWQLREFYPNQIAAIKYFHFVFPACSENTSNRLLNSAIGGHGDSFFGPLRNIRHNDEIILTALSGPTQIFRFLTFNLNERALHPNGCIGKP